MNIAIIGAGRVGTALASGWVTRGHRMTLGTRDPSRTMPGVASLPPADAAARADVVVLPLPWPVAREAVTA